VSNPNQRPRFSLPGSAAPPPIAPAAPAAALAAFPTPWCVGPYGSIWVAADVKRREDGNGWDENFCPRPRCVVHAQDGAWDYGVAQFIVDTVNAAALGGLPKPPC
jgi:hypothetical protein